MADWLATYSGIWLALQVLVHLAISVRIMLWNDGSRRYRPGVSFLAFVMAGSSAAGAANIVLRWHFIAEQTVQPFMTIFAMVILVLLMKSRGNVAYLLPG